MRNSGDDALGPTVYCVHQGQKAGGDKESPFAALDQEEQEGDDDLVSSEGA